MSTAIEMASNEKVDQTVNSSSYRGTDYDESHLHHEEDEPGVHFRSIMCIIGCIIAYFAQVFGLVATGVYSRQIALALNAPAKTVWIPTVGQIVLSVLGPPLGLSADILGRKWFVIGAQFIGIVGCAVAASAQNINNLIGGAVLIGVTFAVQGQILAIPSEVMPRKYRAAAQAMLNGFSGLGGTVAIFSMGPLAKGYWRGIYWTMAGLYGLAFITFFFFYRPIAARPNMTGISHHTSLAQVDWIGAGLLAAGLVPLFMGLTWGDNPYPWSSAHVLAPLIIGIVFCFVFIVYEWKGRDDGLLHHGLFSRSRNFFIAMVLVFVEGAVFFSFTAFYPQQTAIIYEHDAYQVGMRYSAFFLGTILLSPVIGFLATLFREVKWLLLFGFTLFLASTIGMATATPGSNYAVVAYAALGGLGFSAPLILLLTVAQLAAPGELLALASANILMARGVGGAVASAAYQALESSKLNAKLAPYIIKAVAPLGFNLQFIGPLIGAAANGDAPTAFQIPGMTPQILGAAFSAATNAFADAFRYVWILTSALVAVAIIGIFTLEPIKASMTGHVDASAEVDELSHDHHHA